VPQSLNIADEFVSWADELVTWIGDGNTLRSFCRQAGKPSKSLVYETLARNENLAGRIARARDEGHDAIADECVEIADTAEDANIGKLRVWTRLQLLAKWNPTKYGEKVQNVVTGANGGPLQLITDIPRPQRD
jgi:terminase small subunit-like protein